MRIFDGKGINFFSAIEKSINYIPQTATEYVESKPDVPVLEDNGSVFITSAVKGGNEYICFVSSTNYHSIVFELSGDEQVREVIFKNNGSAYQTFCIDLVGCSVIFIQSDQILTDNEVYVWNPEFIFVEGSIPENIKIKPLETFNEDFPIVIQVNQYNFMKSVLQNLL